MHGLQEALLGTLFTWGLTALGSAGVLFIPTNKRSILDVSLGFSGGVMLAASYWSLLAPALSLAEEQGWANYSCVPVSLGFFLGSAFVYLADLFLPENLDLLTKSDEKTEKLINYEDHKTEIVSEHSDATVRQRKTKKFEEGDVPRESVPLQLSQHPTQVRKLMLLVIAITIHNFPEGLAVGVGYASVGRPGVSIQDAHNLALGIGLQNFPEGLAVSVPLKAAGYSTTSSFFWGQASGMVEPLAGVLGVVFVNVAEQVLSVALSFAAGAMIWVVVSDIIPESSSHGNGKLCSYGVIVGFIVMMSLDTALG